MTVLVLHADLFITCTYLCSIYSVNDAFAVAVRGEGLTLSYPRVGQCASHGISVATITLPISAFVKLISANKAIMIIGMLFTKDT